MNPRDKQILITYRIARADESLQAAHLLLEHQLLIPAMNRVYYAMFYAVQAVLALQEAAFSKHEAVLALQEVAFSKHEQVKGYFNREVIKTGIFPVKFGKLYNMVFEYCQKFDYVDLAMPNETMVRDPLQEAKTFIEQLRDYIHTKTVEAGAVRSMPEKQGE
jgi:uncharacterized protein (UPF0332 family)